MKKLILFMLFVAQLAYGQVSTTIQFKVNTTTIIENKNYEYFKNSIISEIADKDIEKVLIIGAASPEGDYKKNLELAEKRAEKIYSHISQIVPRNKIEINNDYDLFLTKTGLDETDYRKLRASYIEIKQKEENRKDTIYIRDTIYVKDTFVQNNIYNYYTEVHKSTHNKPVFSIYNDLVQDLAFRLNIGTEIYFKKMSFFIEGSFSDWSLFGKIYNIDTWYTGFRKYFNEEYNKFFIEAHINIGYFDTDLFSNIGKIGVLYGGGIGLGWTFKFCSHWKLSPIVRIGLFERIYYADYYYSENGNINISFGNYSNGNINNQTEQLQENKQAIITTSKTITKEFFENSNKAYYIGPTYVGIILKRDFCIIKNKNK